MILCELFVHFQSTWKRFTFEKFYTGKNQFAKECIKKWKAKPPDVERHTESVKQRQDAFHSAWHATDSGPTVVDGDIAIRLTRKTTCFNPVDLASTSES